MSTFRLILLLLLCSPWAWGQPRDEAIPTREFHAVAPLLSANRVNNMAQDRFGHLWLSTDQSLYRFNGRSLHEFIPGDATGLPNGAISTLHTDASGQMWVGVVGKGLVYYDEYQDQFQQLLSVSDALFALPLEIDAHGQMWVGTSEGVLRKTPEDQFESFPTWEGVYIKKILDNGDGGLWVCGTNEIYLWYPEKNLRYTVHVEDQIGPSKALEKNYGFNSLVLDSIGNLWVGTSYNGLLRITPPGPRQGAQVTAFVHHEEDPWSLAGNSVMHLEYDSHGRLWVGVENGGLCVYVAERDGFYTYKGDVTDQQGLSPHSVWEILEDQNGRLWVGTFDQGVLVHDPGYRKFEHIQHTSGDNSWLPHNNITSFAESPNGDLWIGTDGGGIAIWNPKHHSHQQLKADRDDPNSLGANAVLDILPDGRGSLWIGSWEGGLNRYDLATQRMHRLGTLPEDPNGIMGNRVMALDLDAQGRIWAAVFDRGLSVYDPAQNRFFHLAFDYRTGKRHPVSSPGVLSLAVDPQGVGWLGTDNGLNRISLHDNGIFKSEQYFADPHDSLALLANAIYSIDVTRDGSVWVSTQSGICRYLPEKNGFARYSQAQGLPPWDYMGLLEDEQGVLWVSASQGVLQMTSQPDGTYAVQIHDVYDGLQPGQFNRHALYQTRQGHLLFGGNQGFNRIMPDQLPPPAPPVPSILTDFKLFNQSVTPGTEEGPLTQPILVADEITLTHTQSVFTLEYTSINYTHPEQDVFAYMLEPLEEEWNVVGGRQSATYTNLDPGEYTFKVKAANHDNIWQEHPTTIRIHILPAWWQTWLFRICAILGLTALVLGGYRLREQQLRRQKKHLEAEVDRRTEELQTSYEQVDAQRRLLAQYYQESSESLRYAQQIQQGILPDGEKLAKHLGDHFVMYRPRNVVSGDFYWLETVGDMILVAVADCTGHGMPGALISLMGNSSLLKAVVDEGLTETGAILDRTRELLLMQFNKSSQGLQEGMDITLAALHPPSKTLQWSGAYNPLWLINPARKETPPGAKAFVGGKGGCAWKGDRQPIGKHPKARPFTVHSLTLQTGDRLYLFSDGFQDQFGGPTAKKYTRRRLQQTLLALQPYSMAEQGDRLRQAFEQWQGDLDQVDDVTLLGFEIKF